MTPAISSILQIGTADLQGGAASVSMVLHRGLIERGVDARMLVGIRRSSDDRVRGIYDTAVGRALQRLTGRQVRRAVHRRLAPWLANDIVGLPRWKWTAAPEVRAAGLLHAHNLHGFFFNLKALPRLTRMKPFVWTLHDMWPMTSHWIHAFDCSHWPEGPCDCRLPNSLAPLRWDNHAHLWHLKRSIYSESELHLVAPSEWMRRQVERGMLGRLPTTVIPNGVDCQRFKPGNKAALRRHLGLPVEGALVLYVGKGGSGNPWKGWRHAVEAVEQLDKRHGARFVFVGGGVPDTLDVIDVGLLKDPNLLADYYAACDLAIYPTLADNCPLAVLEAMASGLPLVAFGAGGVPELVRDGKEGLVVEVGDGEALTRGLATLLEDADLRKAMSRRARRRAVEHYSEQRMVADYVELYGSVSSSVSEDLSTV